MRSEVEVDLGSGWIGGWVARLGGVLFLYCSFDCKSCYAPRVMRDTVGLWLVVATGLYCWSCGAVPAREPAHSATSQDELGYDDESGQPGVSDPCRDGSCFTCGDAVCLPGYYCETIGEKKGCAWVAKCAKSASCSCLQTTLMDDSACSCEEREGNAYVTCSE